jgi:hypothetical protein
MKAAVRAYLESIDFPSRDDYDLSTSEAAFPDGSDYKIELLPTSVAEYEELIDRGADEVPVNKFIDVTGTVFDSDATIREKCELAREAGVQLLMEPEKGHDPSDVSQQMALGAMPGGTVRGVDNLVNTLAEVKRAAELGVRGFNLQDEGVLRVCLKMREDGELPPDTLLKVSSAFNVANPSSLAFWADHLDATDSVNPARDLTIPMLGALRAVTDQPIDVHAFWHEDVVRTHDMPEIVRVAASVSVKNYRVADPGHGTITIGEQYEQSVRVVETMAEEYPEATQFENDRSNPGVPAEPGSDW